MLETVVGRAFRRGERLSALAAPVSTALPGPGSVESVANDVSGTDFARCLRCLLLVMCTHPFAKKALTLHLARSEGHERYFGCNLMHCKVLASSHQHLMEEAPADSKGV